MEGSVCGICMGGGDSTERSQESSTLLGLRPESCRESSPFLRPCPTSKEHTFCKECFQDWVESLGYKNVSCPFCRKGISDEVWRESLRLHGPLTIYSSMCHGRVIAKENYEDGFLHGLQFYYHDHYWKTEAMLREVIGYEHGKKQGVYQVYDIVWKNGAHKSVKVKEGTFLNGDLHGEYREWFLNGKVKKTCRYENGFIDGICEDYKENGVLKSRRIYVNSF